MLFEYPIFFSFPAVRNTCENYSSKQYLIIKNNGDADCVFSVLSEAEFKKKRNISEYTNNHNNNINNNFSKQFFVMVKF